MRCRVADMLYSSTNTFISKLPPPCVCNVGDIPFAEYTRRLCSNIRSKGGVCIMPTTMVRVVSIIFYQYLRFIHIVTLTPPAMHRAMPCGDTMMPFCEGL